LVGATFVEKARKRKMYILIISFVQNKKEERRTMYHAQKTKLYRNLIPEKKTIIIFLIQKARKKRIKSLILGTEKKIKRLLVEPGVFALRILSSNGNVR